MPFCVKISDMHFHWCGNPIHDMIHNGIVLLSMAPEWLPFLRTWALSRQHKGQDHDHPEPQHGPHCSH